MQESFQNGQLGCSEGIPDLQPGILASQAMIEKILSEDPRWQGNVSLSPFFVYWCLMQFVDTRLTLREVQVFFIIE